MPLLNVDTTKVKQEGNAILNTPEKTLYYLLIGTGETKTVLNVGEKTYVGVSKLLAEVQKEERPKVPQGIIDAAKQGAENKK